MKLTKSKLKQIIKEELSLLGTLEIEENFIKKNDIQLNENTEELQNLLRLLQETLTAAATIRPDIALVVGPLAADLRTELEGAPQQSLEEE